VSQITQALAPLLFTGGETSDNRYFGWVKVLAIFPLIRSLKRIPLFTQFLRAKSTKMLENMRLVVAINFRLKTASDPPQPIKSTFNPYPPLVLAGWRIGIASTTHPPYCLLAKMG